MLARTLVAVAVAVGWLAAPASAQVVISVHPLSNAGPNPDNTNPLLATDTAGVVPRANWNVIDGTAANGNGVFAALKNSTGAATTASLAVTGANNLWSLPGVPATPNGKAIQGYLDTTATSTTSLAFTGLFAAGLPRYDVYVYSDGDNGAAVRTGVFTIGGVSQNIVDNGVNFTGTFTEATAGNGRIGNYTVFRGLTTDSFTLTATPLDAAAFRAGVNAVQIVASPVPEPASLALVGGAALAGWGVRRRSKR